MSLSVETLAVARKYTDDSLAGAGAVAGVPCQIQSKTAITGGTRITFLWVDNNGDSHTTVMDVMNGIDGEDGKGIQSVSVNAENHLIITYSDGTTVDAGQIEIHSAVDSVNGQTGAVVLDAEDVGALPDDTPIPSKTSDLTNDSGFITKVVNDLVNYYLKSETYSKAEVDDIVTAIKNSRFEVVATLPTTDIKTNVIYLVPKSPSQTSNVKDEYINLDGTTAGWEKIGDTEIDLSDYVTTQALNTALADYTTTADLTTLLAGKQDTLTFDNAPTENSNNPVKSGGVYAANQTLTSAFTNNVNVNGCKNICPYKLTNYSLRGITITDSADGNYKILNGTCTGNPLIISLLDEVTPYPVDWTDFSNVTTVTPKQLGIDVTKKYVFSRQSFGGGVRFSIYLFNGGTQVAEIALLYDASVNSVEVDFSTYTFDKMFICAKIGIDAVLSNYELKPMLCLKSDWDLSHDYAPYSLTNRQLTDKAAGLWDNMMDNGAVNEFSFDLNAIKALNTSGTWSGNVFTYNNGVTFTVNSDHTITVNGTSSGYAGLRIDFSGNGKKYRLSGCPNGGSSTKFDLTVYNRTVSAEIANEYGQSADFVATSANTLSMYINIRNGQTLNNAVFRPMLSDPSLNLSYDDYVPYAKSNRELTENKVDILTKWVPTLMSSTIGEGFITDLDTPLTSPTQNGMLGFNRYNSSASNKPSNNSGVVLTWETSKNYGCQLVLSDGGLYFRTNHDGTVSSWKQVAFTT